jgi:hypothetical protein
MRLGRLAIAVIASTAFFVHARAASAAETRFTGDDVRVIVDEAGVARVEHAIAYRVSGGTLHGFDLNGVEPEAILDESAPMTIDGETSNGVARVERKGDTALHVTIDGAPKPVRGEKARSFVVRVAYAVDLVRAKEVTLDGAMWKLAWTAPVAPEGYDGARVIFDVPAAPTEPRASAMDGSAQDDGRLVTLRRGPERDELEMERPHVSRAEGAAWVARIDPRAFPRVVDASLRPPPVDVTVPARSDRAIAWLAAALAGALFGAMARAKSRSFARACRRAKVEARGIVPLGRAIRAWGAGLAFGAAVACEAVGLVAWGAAGIVVAMVFAAHRAPRVTAAPRGPGQWLALSPGDAFEGAVPFTGSRALDVATRPGKWTLAFAALTSIALGTLLARIDPSWAWLVPIDAAALLAILATGSQAQFPPDRAHAPARRLASIHRVLRRDAAIRVAPWARVPTGTSTHDELRLLVLPRAAMPGVVGIEVGVAWSATPSGYAGETEVLVRVRDDSAAAARLVALAPRARAATGRKPEERVVRLSPSSATRAGVVALVRRLANELRDRRGTIAESAWSGSERRLPPNERLRVATAIA